MLGQVLILDAGSVARSGGALACAVPSKTRTKTTD